MGFVGAVTEDLPSLVSPAGIADLEVTDIVDEVNDAAADLEAGGADLVVMLVHEGAPNTDCATMDDDPSSTFGNIVNGVSADVDAIVSGHTHLAYNCSFPVAEWEDGPVVTDRPVVSAGQYGTNLNQLVFTVDDRRPASVSAADPGDPAARGPRPRRHRARRPAPLYPADPPVETIVADAVAEANELGAAELGDVTARSTGPAGQRRTATTRAPTATSSRTAAASRRSATWSPRCSAGPPSPRSPAAPRSRS